MGSEREPPKLTPSRARLLRTWLSTSIAERKGVIIPRGFHDALRAALHDADELARLRSALEEAERERDEAERVAWALSHGMEAHAEYDNRFGGPVWYWCGPAEVVCAVALADLFAPRDYGDRARMSPALAAVIDARRFRAAPPVGDRPHMEEVQDG